MSFENPTESITVEGGATVLPERMPDIIAAYRINGDFGFIKVATLFRELRYETDKARSLLPNTWLSACCLKKEKKISS